MKKIHYKTSINEDFRLELFQLTNDYLVNKKYPKSVNLIVIIKGFVFVTIFWLFYFFLLDSNSSILQLLFCYCGLGLFEMIVILNIGHDAVHNSFSKNSRVNAFAANIFEMIGLSNFLWKLRHVDSHHDAPNIPDHDLDIKENKIIRFYHGSAYKKIHRFQVYYAPLLYLFFTLNWLFIRDIKDFLTYRKEQKTAKINARKELLKLVLCKLLYVTYMIVLPIIFLPISWPNIVLGFVLMNFIASALTTFFLITGHLTENSIFPQLDPDGNAEYSWILHQIITTTDFDSGNSSINSILGGFNHHVAHHIFPNVSHIHYPAITKIIIEMCNKHDLVYNSHETLGKAISSHLRLIKNNSIPNINLEI